MDTAQIPDRTCARCGGSMRAGFAAVALDYTTTPLFWVEGALERERLTRGAKTQDREKLPIQVLRCEQCGGLAWEAHAE